MVKGKNEVESKYRVLLVAYKNLENPKELKKHFISIIKKYEDLRDSYQAGDFKGSAGLVYRTSLYHSWFKSKIEEKLKEGYELGIIEMRIEDHQAEEELIEKLSKDYGENVIIVERAEI